MKHIIDTPYGEVVIYRLAENRCDPFDFLFELDSIPPIIEDKLQKEIKIAKERRFKELVKEFPNRFKRLGYETVDQIPEHIIFTELNLKFSDNGDGLEHSEIRRYIVDNLNSDTCSFETEASFPINLSEQIEDLKQLALTYFEKIMFQKRVIDNYIV